MLRQFIRSLKTFIKILLRDKKLAFDLLQCRAEMYLGFSVYLIDPTRIRTRRFELRQTEKPNSDLAPFGNYFLVEKIIKTNPVIMSLGIGEDVRFDEAVLGNLNADLYLFDPTPRSARYVNTRNILNNANFQQIAISDFDGEIEMYIDDLEPDLDTTTSVSIRQPKGSYFSYPVTCKSIKTIMKEEKLTHIDILKLDIEGGGIRVMKNLFEHNIFPDQICGEFERPAGKQAIEKYFSDLKEIFNILRSKGYRIFRTREADIGFQVEITAARY